MDTDFPTTVATFAYIMAAVITYCSGCNCCDGCKRTLHGGVEEMIMKKVFKGVKVSLDQDDLVALTDMKKGSCASTTTSRVYFSAYLRNHIRASSMKKRQTIIYADVAVNEGGGYNPSTGEFTAPRTGGYIFFWEYLVFSGGRMWIYLLKNNQLFVFSLSHSRDPSYCLTSKSAVMNLVEGDKVRVVFDGGDGTLHGAHRYTAFSGFNL